MNWFLPYLTNCWNIAQYFFAEPVSTILKPVLLKRLVMICFAWIDLNQLVAIPLAQFVDFWWFFITLFAAARLEYRNSVQILSVFSNSISRPTSSSPFVAFIFFRVFLRQLFRFLSSAENCKPKFRHIYNIFEKVFIDFLFFLVFSKKCN